MIQLALSSLLKQLEFFLAIVTDSTYNKIARPSQEKCNHMLEFVFNRSLPYLPHEKKVAHQSHTHFSHSEGRLFAKPCTDFPHPRLVLPDDDVIDIVAQIH
jgi:hypothetical protein